MPDKYHVQVQMDQPHVQQYNKQGTKLCFAAGVTDNPTKSVDDAQYNVIARSQTCSAMVPITVEETYGIAGTTTPFENGVQFDPSMNMQPIKFGQSYTQPANWTNGTVNTDSNAPREGFNFINKADKAAAVVYKKIQGSWAPIYISRRAPLSPGTEKLFPQKCLAIWFADAADAGNMTSEFGTEPMKLDLSGNTSGKAVVSYSEEGTWSIVSNN